jgi:hypothetical protein
MKLFNMITYNFNFGSTDYMNKVKKPMDVRQRKKLDKEVRKAQNPASASTLKVLPEGRKELLPKYRKKKPVEMERERRRVEVKKKYAAKHSKRTTPGELEGQDTPPEHVNREGKRWIQTVEKQTLSRTRTLNKKNSKQGPKETRMVNRVGKRATKKGR